MSYCPCGNQIEYSECCGRYHSGAALAPTAEALMRSRYSAYVVCDIDYLVQTLPLLDRKGFDRVGAKEWSKQAEWLGLEIVSTKDGLENDLTGVVEFKAKFKQSDTEFIHHEIGKFKKAGSRWQFIDGKIVLPDADLKDLPTPGRNAACLCGSGKKFKNCCGK
jgi:SEC-C motif-containing protein